MNKSEHPVIENQEEYEAERKLIEFHKGLTEEQKQKFENHKIMSNYCFP